ncbi:MAG: HNH endonuclease, partial [Deltaproteobacteria bacterium]|nr:HNH endonuclease [Deltaproteobacteria bacterium]
MTTETRTLLLTQGYEPIQIISWQRAITLVALEKVEVVHEYDAQIRAVSLVINVPAVVRLRKAFRRHAKPVKFSRVNIYARDSYRCQYCAARCPTDELTYDHVVPRAKGGKTTWENIVSACYACNRTKANRTLAEARMKLLT